MAESAGKQKLQDLCLPERYKCVGVCACVCERERREVRMDHCSCFFNLMRSLRNRDVCICVFGRGGGVYTVVVDCLSAGGQDGNWVAKQGKQLEGNTCMFKLFQCFPLCSASYCRFVGLKGTSEVDVEPEEEQRCVSSCAFNGV